MNIPRILELIRPGEQWTLRGETLEDLEWLDSTPKPTLEELQAGEAQLATLAYRELRAPAYPPIGDQLDALWKGLSQLNSPPIQEMLIQIQAVKAQYPKP